MTEQPQGWQRTVRDVDLHDCVIGFFTFAIAEKRLCTTAQTELLDLIKRYIDGERVNDALVDWSLKWVSSEGWRLIKTRVNAKKRARRVRAQKELISD